MSILDVILPLWVKPLVLAIIVAATWGHGYYKGLLSGERDLDSYKASVSQEAAKAQTRAFRRIIIQKDINHATEQRLTRRLAAANSRLRKYATDDSSRVPALPESPRQPDATTTNQVPIGELNVLQNDYNKLYLDCTATTIIADEWQKRERELAREEQK